MREKYFLRKFNRHYDWLKSRQSSNEVDDFLMETFDLIDDFVFYKKMKESDLLQQLMNRINKKYSTELTRIDYDDICTQCNCKLSLNTRVCELVCENCGLVYDTPMRIKDPTYSSSHHYCSHFVSKYNRMNRFDLILKKYGKLDETTKDELRKLYRKYYERIVTIYSLYERLHLHYLFMITQFLYLIDDHHPAIKLEYLNKKDPNLEVHFLLWELITCCPLN